MSPASVYETGKLISWLANIVTLNHSQSLAMSLPSHHLINNKTVKLPPPGTDLKHNIKMDSCC